MANKKTNITKLIGAFNLYLDSNSNLSFADYVRTKKIGMFEENNHINIMEFNEKKSKYEEFANYLVENYDNYKGDKYKSIALRQILAECLDTDQTISFQNADQQTLSTILSRRPVSPDSWHKTKFVVRKTGKTLLMTGLLSCGIGAALGLFGWGVGLVPGMTGNIISNLATAMSHGAVYGAIIGPTYFVGRYLIDKAKIKKLGSRDKENFNALKTVNLKSIADLENKKIPLMQLVKDFQEDRQVSKSLRTTSNPFKVITHRRKRDLNYIRFCEITESFAQLIDSLEKINSHNNAKIVKEYYLKKFKSMFTHPDFARVADKYSIDKKLTNQNIATAKVSDKKAANNISARDIEAINSAFKFKAPVKVAMLPKITSKKKTPVVKKATVQKDATINTNPNPNPSTDPQKKTTKVLTTPVKKKKVTPVAVDPTKKVTKQDPTKKTIPNTTTKQDPAKKTTPNTTTKQTKKDPVKQTSVAKVDPIKPQPAVIETPSMFDLYPDLEKKTIPTGVSKPTTKKDTTTPQEPAKTKKKTSIIKNEDTVFDKISKEAVLIVENKVTELLKDENSNLIKEMGLTKKAVQTFVKLSDNLHFGQNPITGKDNERVSIASVMTKKEYREKFKDLTDAEYKKIMDYALGNVNIIDQL